MENEHEGGQAGMPAPEGGGHSAATARWMQDLGAAVESLAQMMRSPTSERPFVYELRIDLLPAKGDQALLVAKGFGADGGLVLFNNDNGLLNLLRSTEGRLRAGKGRWYEDQYTSDKYEVRLKRYLAGEFYRLG